ncbi:hypothetical protein GCM10008014_34580 [Paenibacillus silvae]|uniref:Transposase DDE domain-containing protein n=1 Tax=Paenibacillus silvae TaxID=1325358 RepID=A0ABQ1ZH54_9BACL|nr:hypothetical protein GCM10008014_34580 [Paenibacillus silvae]
MRLGSWMCPAESASLQLQLPPRIEFNFRQTKDTCPHRESRVVGCSGLPGLLDTQLIEKKIHMNLFYDITLINNKFCEKSKITLKVFIYL